MGNFIALLMLELIYFWDFFLLHPKILPSISSLTVIWLVCFLLMQAILKLFCPLLQCPNATSYATVNDPLFSRWATFLSEIHLKKRRYRNVYINAYKIQFVYIKYFDWCSSTKRELHLWSAILYNSFSSMFLLWLTWGWHFRIVLYLM